MKVINLKRLEQYKERELYTFSLSLGEFIVNGFLYSRKTGAILSPTMANKRRVVRGWGMSWKRLRSLLESAILKRATIREAEICVPMNRET